VQEAADEEANIIFGAVVDPGLKGKVKITVIATGFGQNIAQRSPEAPAQTPVDMSAYIEQPRVRAEPVAPAPSAAAQTSRFSLAPRRVPFDLPLTAAGSHGGTLHTDPGMSPARGAETDNLELSSPLDIPAFLRRQEG
jgi:cell division protein FtsZ